MKLRHQGTEITEIVTKIEWSGDYKQGARTLTFGVAVSPHDPYLLKTTIKMGDMVRLLDDKDKEVFRGYVFDKQKSINSSEMTVTCYDGLVYLLESKGTYNFKKMTPQAITSKVASDFDIQLGHLESGSNLDRMFDAETIYSIIMTAYSIEGKKTGRLFILGMLEGKLNVTLKGSKTTKYVLDTKSTIINSTYSESIRNSINKVKIYDQEGNSKGEVNLSGIPGVLQDIYKQEEGIDSNTAATAMLKGVEKTASIEALGDFECVTGNAVIVKEPFTGLSGLFYIDNDTHTFENGQHRMTLGLAFKNMMDFQESGEDPNKTTGNGGSSGSGSGSSSTGTKTVTGTGKDRVWSFLKSKGVSDAAAAAIMGNLEQESNINPKRRQDGGGPGRGIMQWEEGKDRFNSLKELAKKRGTTWEDLDTQLEFMWYEINNEKKGVSKLKSLYGMTPTQLLQSNDVAKITKIFEICYERAGKPNYPKREQYANDFLAKYKKTNGVISTSSSSNKTQGKRGELIRAAETMLDFTYSQPNRMGKSSADCSSLVGRAMKIAGITNDPFLTTRSIHNDDRFVRIEKSQLKPGDVLWESGHMGLYIGDNKLIEASSSAKKVRYANLGNRFTYAYRIKGLD